MSGKGKRKEEKEENHTSGWDKPEALTNSVHIISVCVVMLFFI